MNSYFKVVILSMMLFGINVRASAEVLDTKLLFEKTEACGRFVYQDRASLYAGHSDGRGVTAIKKISRRTGESIEFRSGLIVDMVSSGNRAYLLKSNALEEWDLSSLEKIKDHPSIHLGRDFRYQENAQGMDRYKNKIIIAHGRLGLSIFDINKKRTTRQIKILKSQLPLESVAKDVVVIGKYAYVVVDNFHLVRPPKKPPFRGVLIVDMESERVVRELDGMDPGVTWVNGDSQSLIVSFGGSTIWRYDLQSLHSLQNQLPEPKHRLWSYPLKGQPVGKALMDEKYYYTCFRGGDHRTFPISLDRESLKIN